MDEHMLTTMDNPYDPFTRYDEWDRFDQEKGYYTSSLLARFVITSEELSEADQDLALEQAMWEIAKDNLLGNYRLVTKDEKVFPKIKNLEK